MFRYGNSKILFYKNRQIENKIGNTFVKKKMEKEMGNHSSTLGWRIPRTEEPGGLPSMGSQSRTRLCNFHFHVNFSGGLILPMPTRDQGHWSLRTQLCSFEKGMYIFTEKTAEILVYLGSVTSGSTVHRSPTISIYFFLF